MSRNISICSRSSSGLSNVLHCSRRRYKKIKKIKNKTANPSGNKKKNEVKISNPKTVLGPKNPLQIYVVRIKCFVIVWLHVDIHKKKYIKIKPMKFIKLVVHKFILGIRKKFYWNFGVNYLKICIEKLMQSLSFYRNGNSEKQK